MIGEVIGIHDEPLSYIWTMVPMSLCSHFVGWAVCELRLGPLGFILIEYCRFIVVSLLLLSLRFYRIPSETIPLPTHTHDRFIFFTLFLSFVLASTSSFEIGIRIANYCTSFCAFCSIGRY